MKRCFALSKSGNRLNINTFKRQLYPRLYSRCVLPADVVSSPMWPSASSSPSVSKASRLSFFTRLILWIRRKIFRKIC